jgi:hypothetical protein
MDEQTQKRIDEIKARRKGVEDAKTSRNYCESWAAMHRFQGHALNDVDFLLEQLEALRSPVETQEKRGL